jgi:hypothetical protein
VLDLGWEGRTVVCIASGPSLSTDDVALVEKSGLPAVVTNTTFRLCPWAAALYANDLKWWKVYHDEVATEFRGRRFSGSVVAQKYGAEWFRGLSNSGAGAISLALAGGASRVILLGYDCGPAADGRTHWHGDHPRELSNAASMLKWAAQFAAAARHAARRGVTVINTSRRTSLNCFPRAPLENALC